MIYERSLLNLVYGLWISMQTYIPYQLRVKLKQIDPILDSNWQQELDSILSATPKALQMLI